MIIIITPSRGLNAEDGTPELSGHVKVLLSYFFKKICVYQSRASPWFKKSFSYIRFLIKNNSIPSSHPFFLPRGSLIY